MMKTTGGETSRCRNCGRVLNEGTKFCPECGAKVEKSTVSDAAPQKKMNTVENTSVQRSAAGIIGIVGTIIACLGIFMPMLEAWGQRISYFGMIMDSDDTGNTGLCIILGIIFFVIIELYCFISEINGVGNVLAIIAFLLFLFSMFGSGEIPASELMNYVGYGFWVMCAGLIAMSISSIFSSGKKQ